MAFDNVWCYYPRCWFMYPVTAVTDLQKGERIIEPTIFVDTLTGYRMRRASLPHGEGVENVWAWASVDFYPPRFGQCSYGQ